MTYTGQIIQGAVVIKDALPIEAKITACTPSTAELWFMVINSARIQENLGVLSTVLQRFVCWNFTQGAAVAFGQIKAKLRRTGRPIPDIDIQIAAIARIHDLTVLTADAHFNYLSDLRTDNWLA